MLNKPLTLAADLYPLDDPSLPRSDIKPGTSIRLDPKKRGCLPADLAVNINKVGWNGDALVKVIKREGGLIRTAWQGQHFDIPLDFIVCSNANQG